MMHTHDPHGVAADEGQQARMIEEGFRKENQGDAQNDADIDVWNKTAVVPVGAMHDQGGEWPAAQIENDRKNAGFHFAVFFQLLLAKTKGVSGLKT